MHFKQRNCLVEGALSNLQVSLLQFSRPKQTYRGPQRYQMSHQRDGANGNFQGRGRQEYHDNGSVANYIPDDVSSVHSSITGGVGVASAFPPMFSGFHESWPSLNGRRTNGGRSQVGTESVTGESVTATDSEINGPASSVTGKGGVSLGGMSIQNAKPNAYNQSDRLKRYLESDNRPSGSVGGSSRGTRDDDMQSISTAFASQVGLGNYD